MSDVWEPVGPLPAAVYWRRRFVALASAVTMVFVVIATAGTAGNAPARPVPAAERSTVPTPAGGAVPTQAGGGRDGPLPSRDADAPAAEGAADPTTAGPAPRSTPSATAGPSAPTTTATRPPGPAANDPFSAASIPGAERIRPDDATPSTAPPSPVPLPSTGPGPCTNAMLSATAELDHLVHRVGSHPVLRLVITNTSGQPCVRDLDPARQEIVVWSEDGRDRLWSSNDCANASTIDLRTLVPGRPVAFAVTWGERTTTPGCRQPRTVVPAGAYRLLVRLDDLISGPTPFIRTP